MCGFAGILTSQNWHSTELIEAAGRMSATLRHRGPDDSGAWVSNDRRLAFGFRRLSIIDLSERGNQPMRSASGRFTIVYNGEVYNHLDIRRELEKEGFVFRGSSDTEVVLAAIERWGLVDAIGRFVGMFAMAVWDDLESRLHLALDRFGIKPLFVHWKPGILTFGSELKALLAGPDFDVSLDPEAVVQYLRFLYVPPPRTIYKSAFKLLPGHILTVSDPDRPPPSSVPYWSLEEVAARGLANPLGVTEEQAISLADRMLRDAVVKEMHADVPLGAFLSGGIDSSLLVALMQSATDRPVQTFSISFQEEAYDEAADAARVAKYLGTDHTEFTLTPAEARDAVPRLVQILDEPFANPAAIANLLLSQLARRAVTVAVSGTGGDEVFGGYNRYVHGARLLRWLDGVPQPVRRAAAAGVGAVDSERWTRFYDRLSNLLPAHLQYRLAGRKFHKLEELLRQPSPAAMYRSLLSVWQKPESLVVGGHEGGNGLLEALDGQLKEAHWLDRIMLADQLTYLVGDQLAMVDRVSMAASLEVRVPLLDHQVVEFAWRLPRPLKVRGSQGKWLLRQVLYRHVPPELVDRAKMGLSLPVEEWLRGPLKPWAEELLTRNRLERSGILQAGPIRKAWNEFQSGRREFGLGLWAVVMLQAWADRGLP